MAGTEIEGEGKEKETKLRRNSKTIIFPNSYYTINRTTTTTTTLELNYHPRKAAMTSPRPLEAPDPAPSEGVTPLMLACLQKRLKDVKIHLRKNKDSVRSTTKSGKVPLHFCAEGGSSQCLELLLAADSSLINASDEEGYTPLHLAVINGNTEIVKRLIAASANVNCVDHEKHTPVHWATVCGELEILDILLTAGASATSPDIHLAHPIHYASQICGNGGIGRRGEHGGRVQSSMYGVSPKKGLAILQRLLQHGVSVDVKDRDGRQPLLWSASAGSADGILCLVNAGASVQAEDKDGLTALHCAASRGHTDCLETLVALCGAEVDVIDNNGCTAIFYAVTLGHADCTELLLKFGAEPNRQDRKGRTPAHCGASKGQLETIKLIGKHGGNLWIKNVRGDLPLHEAVISRRRDLVLWLLSQRPDTVNAGNNDGRCPIHLAAINNNVEMVKILIDHNAEINPLMRTGKGVAMTPLDAAMHKGNSAVAKFLQLHGGLPANTLNSALALQRRNAESEARAVSSLRGSVLSRPNHESSPDTDLKSYSAPNDAEIYHYANAVAASILKQTASVATATPAPTPIVDDSAQTDASHYQRHAQTQVSKSLDDGNGAVEIASLSVIDAGAERRLSSTSTKSGKRVRKKRKSLPRDKSPSGIHESTDSGDNVVAARRPSRHSVSAVKSNSNDVTSTQPTDAAVQPTDTAAQPTDAATKDFIPADINSSTRPISSSNLATALGNVTVCDTPVASEVVTSKSQNEVMPSSEKVAARVSKNLAQAHTDQSDAESSSERFSELDNVFVQSSESEVRDEELGALEAEPTLNVALLENVANPNANNNDATEDTHLAASESISKSRTENGSTHILENTNLPSSELNPSTMDPASEKCEPEHETEQTGKEAKVNTTNEHKSDDKVNTISAHNNDPTVNKNTEHTNATPVNKPHEHSTEPTVNKIPGNKETNEKVPEHSKETRVNKHKEHHTVNKLENIKKEHEHTQKEATPIRTPDTSLDTSITTTTTESSCSCSTATPPISSVVEVVADTKHIKRHSTPNVHFAEHETPSTSFETTTSSGSLPQKLDQSKHLVSAPQKFDQSEHLVSAPLKAEQSAHSNSAPQKSNQSARLKSTEAKQRQKFDLAAANLNQSEDNYDTVTSKDQETEDTDDTIRLDGSESLSLQEAYAAHRRRRSKLKQDSSDAPPAHNENSKKSALENKPLTKTASAHSLAPSAKNRERLSVREQFKANREILERQAAAVSKSSPTVADSKSKKAYTSASEAEYYDYDDMSPSRHPTAAHSLPTRHRSRIPKSSKTVANVRIEERATLPLPSDKLRLGRMRNVSEGKSTQSEGTPLSWKRDSGYSDQVHPTTSASEDQNRLRENRLNSKISGAGLRRKGISRRPGSNSGGTANRTNLNERRRFEPSSNGGNIQKSKFGASHLPPLENGSAGSTSQSHGGSVTSDDGHRTKEYKAPPRQAATVRPRSKLTFTKGEDLNALMSPYQKKSMDVDTPISVTQAMQASMRKYQLERKIFQELLELKRLQIRAGKANEQILVKRLADGYRKAGLSINYREFDGAYTFRNFEKYLYDQLRLLQANRKLLPRFAPSDDLEKLSLALKKMNATKLPFLDDYERPESLCAEDCTHMTHRCHHASHSYVGIPCAAYITKGRRTPFLPKVDTSRPPGPISHHARTPMPNPSPGVQMIIAPRREETASPITVEVQQGSSSQVFTLPNNSLDPSKNYYVSLSIQPSPRTSPTKRSRGPVTVTTSSLGSNVTKLPPEDSGSISAPPPSQNSDKRGNIN